MIERRKVTFCMPASLHAHIDSLAKQQGVSRSQIVVGALEEMQERAAVEGYRFYSEEALEFAKATEQIASEIWPDWGSYPALATC